MKTLIKNEIILFSILIGLVFSISNYNRISIETNSDSLKADTKGIIINQPEIKISGDNDYTRKFYFFTGFWGGLCTGDQDNDGKKEIIIGGTSYVSVFEYNATYNNYTRIYDSNLFNDDYIQTCCTDDLDGDTNKEIMGLCDAPSNVLRVLEHDVGDNKYISVLNKSIAISDIEDMCIGDDLDRDGNKEIIVVGQNYVKTYEYNGTLDGISETWASPKLGNYFDDVDSSNDLDNDGRKEIICSDGSKTYVFENTKNNTYIGVWNTSVINNRVCFGNDLDGDGKKEIIARGNNNRIYIFEYNGTDNGYSAVWNSSNIMSGYILSICTNEDLDGDGKKEIIVGSSDNKIYIFEYNGTDNGYSLVWDSGSLLKNDIERLCIGDDLDRDGKKEIIAGLYGGYIHIFQHDDTIQSTIIVTEEEDDDDDDDNDDKEGIYISYQILIIGGGISAAVIAVIVIILIKKK